MHQPEENHVQHQQHHLRRHAEIARRQTIRQFLPEGGQSGKDQIDLQIIVHRNKQQIEKRAARKHLFAHGRKHAVPAEQPHARGRKNGCGRDLRQNHNGHARERGIVHHVPHNEHLKYGQNSEQHR